MKDIPKGQVICYLDSTGSIIAPPPDVEATVYYYTLLVPGKVDETSQPFPFAEMISTVQSVPFVSSFLQQFHYSLQLITNRGPPIIDKIKIDFSSTLMQSVS